MPRLLIGNEFNEDRAALAEAKRRGTAWWTHRLLWFAEQGDVVVVAVLPEEPFVAYVTELLGIPMASVRFVVPPPGELGAGVLTADRLSHPDFLAELRSALDGRDVTEVIALHPDSAVAELAATLGLEKVLPGGGFLSQEGSRLVGSKAAFRAIAAGVGAPVPAGGVCTTRAGAEALAWPLLERGRPVMFKHDMRSGGRGNEIVSPVPGVTPVGAQRSVVTPDRAALRSYLTDRWDWLSSHGRSPVVVERYHTDCRAVFAEFAITDAGVELGGHGELFSAPLAAAEIIPTPDVDPSTLADLVEGGRRLSAALHAIGYRGRCSADAIITVEGAVLFTEYNGRITGSTPAYAVIGKVLAGPDYERDRVLLDRDGWSAPSFAQAERALAEAGLRYDRATRTGVVLVMPHNTGNDTLRYCVVATDLDSGRECQNRVEAMFGAVPV